MAREDDLSKLTAVERRASELFAGTTHAYLCDAPTLSMSILAAQHGAGAVWVAADESDEPVGFAVAGELGDEAYVYEIDVAPEHGRQGLGRRLMHAAMEWARKKDYPTLTLSTCVDVAWNAPFYATLGFEVVAEREMTPAMAATRTFEAKAGFDMDRRVFMRCRLRPPNLALGVSSPTRRTP